MIAFLIILGIMAYIITGRIIMVVMDKHDWIMIWNEDYSYANLQILFGSIFFPIVLLWSAMSMIGDVIIKKFI